MLAAGREEEVCRLLAAGLLSQRHIARRTGVSRQTVDTIAGGKRSYPLVALPAWEDAPDPPPAPPERCPTCGGLVYMPCHLCRMREWMEKRKQDKETHRSHPGGPRRLSDTCPPGLALKPFHRRRYEDIRRRRKALEIIE